MIVLPRNEKMEGLPSWPGQWSPSTGSSDVQLARNSLRFQDTPEIDSNNCSLTVRNHSLR